MTRYRHRDALILRYLANGHSRLEAAEHFGLLFATIQRIETRATQRSRALEMIRAGGPTREISEAVGKSHSTILNWAHAEGLQVAVIREKRLTSEKIAETRRFQEENRVKREAARAEHLRVRMNPDEATVQAILAMHAVGREEIAPGIVIRTYRTRDIEAAFSDRVDLNTITRILRGAR